MKLTPCSCLLYTLAVLATLAPTPWACSDMLLADPSVSPAVVGFRNLDFPPMAEASRRARGHRGLVCCRPPPAAAPHPCQEQLSASSQSTTCLTTAPCRARAA